MESMKGFALTVCVFGNGTRAVPFPPSQDRQGKALSVWRVH